MSLQLVVWNSQGNKWVTFWTAYLNPLVPTGQDIMGLLVESGWAPWVTPGEVYENNIYQLESDVTWYWATNAAASPLCQAIEA